MDASNAASGGNEAPSSATANGPSSAAAMGDAPFSRQQLEATARRFAERQPARMPRAFEVSARAALADNPPEQVEKRLRRLARLGAAVPADESLAMLAGGRAAVTPRDEITLERILGRNQLIDARFLRIGVAAARAVGRIHIRNATRRLGFGTGFLVSPRLLLTNQHVLSTPDEARHSLVEFNYERDEQDQTPPTSFFALEPERFFVSDAALDFSLVAVQERAGDGSRLSDYGFNRLIDDDGGVLVDELANIVQHPNGEPKQLALRENQVQDILADFFHYHTDTAPGSSGSPVYNDQWEVIALHHSGVPRRDGQGNILARDGQLWRRDMGEHRINWIANEGVRIGSIRRHLQNLRVPPAWEPLREGLLRPEAAGSAPSDSRTGAASHGPGSSAGGAVAAAGEQLFLTVPLHISLRVGQATVGGMTTGNAGASGAPTATAGVTATPSGSGAVPAAPAHGFGAGPGRDDVRAALAQLERSRHVPYYDEAADRQERDGYYRDLLEAGSTAELYDRLSGLLVSTHHTAPRYRPMAEVYPWVDLQPNRKLRSIYSDIEYDPEDFIREDAAIEERRSASLRELVAEAAVDPELLRERMDLLEAALPYNCEHVVPQSWFGKREPMRGDLHHLFACESGCNSFRGNTPYFDFGLFIEADRGACGRRVGDKFEPEKGKGKVARAVLYFLLRYPGEINRSGSEYDEERLETLLRWHAENEVTEHERHRNRAIFQRQGNRNPLIDRPEIASRIDFTRGLGD